MRQQISLLDRTNPNVQDAPDDERNGSDLGHESGCRHADEVNRE